MSTIPTTEPVSAFAGDTITWTRSLPDYPATAGWVLSYVLLSASGRQAVTGSASGADHLISVPASTSAAWTAGTYAWQAYVSKGAERYTVGTGSIEILKNFASQLTASDTRTHARRVLDAIEAVLEGTATTDQQELTINGTTLKRRTIADLLKLRDYYKTEVAKDKAAEKINQGLKPGNRIMVRFT